MNVKASDKQENAILLSTKKRSGTRASKNIRPPAIMVGFTLVEMLLVLTIISAIIYGSITFVQQRTMQTQVDRTSSQMQQILSAALSYYIANGQWPASLDCLTGGQGGICNLQYLPSIPTNPWGNNYSSASSTAFYVYTGVPSPSSQPAYGSSIAATIAGSLPSSYISADTGTPPSTSSPCPTTGTPGNCYVVSSVNAPISNLQNAGTVNFAGIYHHGGCVPVPQCPLGPNNQPIATPEVIIVPISVSGLNNDGDSSSYPITSFTAYATGGPGYRTPPACNDTGNESAVSCGDTASTSYWRACLDVVTQLGDVAQTNPSTSPSTEWGQFVTLMAITRCSLNGEDSGSPYTTVYSN